MFNDLIHEEDNSHVRRPVGRTGRIIVDQDEADDLIRGAYVALLSQNWASVRHTPKGQKILCDLCDALANITEKDAEIVQNEAELAALSH